MYVCICNSVTDRDIRKAAAAGANSLDDLREELGVASCCGTCACAAEAVLKGEADEGSNTSRSRGATSPSVPCAVPATL